MGVLIMKIYLASGWFSPEQEQARQEVLQVCETLKLDYYSPKERLQYGVHNMSQEEVFMTNLSEILKADLVIASTEGKDMGTLFECGYAYGRKIPIIYYYKYTDNFNLMLGQSGKAVLTNPYDLSLYIRACVSVNDVINSPYQGGVE